MAQNRQMMTAIEISQPGGPEVLQPCQRPLPTPADGELLIKVAAAGVNRPDCMQRQGRYPPPPGAPDIPGLEIAGTIVKGGRDSGDFAVGAQVCGLVAGGGYAEYCLLPEANALPIPDGLSLTQAAALPETFFTVWTNLFDRAQLKGGESVLIHGGSSGIGTTAIQLAKSVGARIFATAGSTEKCAACEDLGAEQAINYKTQDFVAEIQSRTEGAGVDVILDMVGGDYVMRNINCLAVEGRLVQIALQRGPKVADMNILPILTRRLTFTGSTLRPRTIAQKALIRDSLRQNAWPLLASGAVAPVIDSTYPLTEAAKAHARMEGSQHIGKIVLEA